MFQLQFGLREEGTGGEELRDPQSGAITHAWLRGLSASREARGGRVSAPQAPPFQPPARPFWTRPSLILGGQWVLVDSLACLPPSLPSSFFFLLLRGSAAPQPGYRSNVAAPAPSCKGEIAKLVAIMTLHSGRRLPLNFSAPWPARPNQSAPPCCPPSPRPPLPPPPPAHKKWGTKSPRISPSLC